MQRGTPNRTNTLGIAVAAFLFGCILSSTIVLNYVAISNDPPHSDLGNSVRLGVGPPNTSRKEVPQPPKQQSNSRAMSEALDSRSTTSKSSSSSSTNPLFGQKILIAIAAFDFAQIPHLGEVLDAYQDLCVTGATKVDVVIHATVAYPVTLIDMLNARMLSSCKDVLSIEIVLKPSQMRLHLVDVHRALFYSKIDEYDLFIYTEDDIRVPPRVVGAYLEETKNVQEIVGKQKASDFNVGIIRYEYNFPSNAAIDDKTRHATQNVTRVYWEHGFYPVFPEALAPTLDRKLKDSYVTMRNAHQGMFLATRDLLKAWKERKNCNFHIASNRPSRKGEASQPLLGTQRVWMSSNHLYNRQYGCGVKQVLPTNKFGTLTVLHMPNKNYRRVGHFRNRTFSDGTEVFDFGSPSLLSELRLHLEIRINTKQVPTLPYAGIRMTDEIIKKRQRSPLLERRMGEYQAYVDRGGILSEEDMGKTALVEDR